MAAVIACGGAALSACGGSHVYVPLTAANLGTTLISAAKNLHTAHEVSTSNGVTTTIDFDTAGGLKYRLTQSSGAGASAQSMIGIGSVRYVQEPGVTPVGKWLRISPGTGGVVLTFNDLNPVAMVARFNKGVEKFMYLGPTKISGSQVQHYRITIDQQKYLKATGQGLGSANLGSGQTLTEDLYLNSDDTLRRVTLMLPGGVGNTQLDVTNWGQAVTIEAPPASAVVTSVANAPKK